PFTKKHSRKLNCCSLRSNSASSKNRPRSARPCTPLGFISSHYWRETRVRICGKRSIECCYGRRQRITLSDRIGAPPAFKASDQPLAISGNDCIRRYSSRSQSLNKVSHFSFRQWQSGRK